MVTTFTSGISTKPQRITSSILHKSQFQSLSPQQLQKEPQRSNLRSRLSSCITQVRKAHYVDKEGEIDSEGIEKFFHDLGVDSMDLVTLVVSYKMNAKSMGLYKLDEF